MNIIWNHYTTESAGLFAVNRCMIKISINPNLNLKIKFFHTGQEGRNRTIKINLKVKIYSESILNFRRALSAISG
jgi:hypothetical protein